jgi:teichuronic acid biosynthesis glycosyltransferase TuaG
MYRTALAEMTPPRFSVVVPCHNAARYLDETLKSVLRQSYEHFEVVVVDDASTDKSWEIIQAYKRADSRVHSIQLPVRSGGPAVPRNVGIVASRGEYVAFIDADDLWGADKLKHDSEYLQMYQADILYSGVHYFRGDQNNILFSKQMRKMSRLIRFVNFVPLLTMCVRRGLFEEGLSFETDSNLVAIEDYHFLLDAYFLGKRIEGRPTIDAYYRQNSLTSIYAGDFDSLMRRVYYSATKLAIKHRLGINKLSRMLLGTYLLMMCKKICRRL